MKDLMKLELLNRIDKILLKTTRIEAQPEIFRIINLRQAMLDSKRQLADVHCSDYQFELIFMVVNLAETTLQDHFKYNFGVQPK